MPMPRVFVTTRDGSLHEVDLQHNRSLMEALRDKNVGDLVALCGGCCSCATCHVYVDPVFKARLPPMSEDEAGLLDGSLHRTEDSRLSCQISVTDSLDGLRISVAPEN
jgi:ferredoxin, 2Fe-2S